MKNHSIDEKRLYRMIKLARYEEIEGVRDLQIVRYYMRNYLGLNALKNFFLITIAFLLVLGVFTVYKMDYVLEKVKGVDFKTLLLVVGIIYLAVLACYLVGSIAYGVVRYKKAKERVDKLGRDIETLYGKDELDEDDYDEDDYDEDDLDEED